MFALLSLLPGVNVCFDTVSWLVPKASAKGFRRGGGGGEGGQHYLAKTSCCLLVCCMVCGRMQNAKL